MGQSEIRLDLSWIRAAPEGVKGSATNLGGKVKEGAGDLTGDKKLKNEGILDQVMGRVRNAIGGIKDAIKRK